MSIAEKLRDLGLVRPARAAALGLLLTGTPLAASSASAKLLPPDNATVAGTYMIANTADTALIYPWWLPHGLSPYLPAPYLPHFLSADEKEQKEALLLLFFSRPAGGVNITSNTQAPAEIQQVASIWRWLAGIVL